MLIDDLAGDGVLRYVRRSARIVRVGKRGGCVSTSQAFIDRLMVSEARRGERVVRVKGGDPFVFGRGGEEADALREAGVDVEVIGGITSGIAAPAAIGVPVTGRRHAPGVAFVTGHVREGGTEPDWGALARSGLTIVICMGMSRCADIGAALIAGGRDAATSVAVVQHACTPQMRSHLTTLGRMADDVREQGLGSPAVIVVGDVVRLAARWKSVVGVADDVQRPAGSVVAGAIASGRHGCGCALLGDDFPDAALDRLRNVGSTF